LSRVIRRTGKAPPSATIAHRISLLEGKTWGECRNMPYNKNGRASRYSITDFKYDLGLGIITVLV
jgi:hypothetical protein